MLSEKEGRVIEGIFLIFDSSKSFSFWETRSQSVYPFILSFGIELRGTIIIWIRLSSRGIIHMFLSVRCIIWSTSELASDFIFKKLYPSFYTNVNGGILVTDDNTEHRYWLHSCETSSWTPCDKASFIASSFDSAQIALTPWSDTLSGIWSAYRTTLTPQLFKLPTWLFCFRL